MKLSFILCSPVPDLAELDRRMGIIAGLGYQGVELSASHPAPYPISEVTALTHKHQLPVVSMLSGWSYTDEGLCLSSPKADVRDRAVKRLIDYVGQAAQLGAVLVFGLMQGTRSDEENETVANQRIAAGLRLVADEARKQGVTVVLEPVNHMQVGFNQSAAQAVAMTEQVASPALGFMLDTIHMNIEEKSLLNTIRTYGRRIRHFHLCETNGGPLGSGGLDFPGVLQALAEVEYAHFVSIKIYRNIDWEEGARTAIAFLRELRANHST